MLSALIGRVRVPDPIAARALSGRGNGRLPYSWNPRYPARVGVLPRDGDNADVRWFEIEPCYVFHPLNAYDADDGTAVVLDVVRHPKMFDTELRGPAEGIPTLDRWTVDMSAGKVRQERLDDRPQEFPRINEQLVGKPHRYGYSAGLGIGCHADNDTVFKHDLRRGTSATRSFGKGTDVGEFVFEARPGATAEDDGILMGLVYDAADDRSDLVMLDGASMETVAAVHLPTRVPAGFHGNWIPTDQGARKPR